MELIITHDHSTFTLDNARIERLTFTRTGTGPRVKMTINGVLVAEFTGSIDIPFDRPGRHESLLPLWAGNGTVEGLLPTDRLVIQFRPATPKVAPIYISEHDRQRMIQEYREEQGRKR